MAGPWGRSPGRVVSLPFSRTPIIDTQSLMYYSTIRRFAIAIFAVGLLGLTACDQTIDKSPEQSISSNLVFDDASGARAALTGAYDGLQHNGVFGGFPVMAADFTTSNVTFSGSFTDWNNAEAFNVTAEHFPTENLWSDHYDAINRANLVIDNVPTVDDLSASEKDDLIGQAKFIRALLYFDLVRWFARPYNPGGNNDHPGVILATDGVRTTAPDFNKPRAPVADIYAQIRSDLTDAINRLEVKAARKRAGQASANALLAKVSLYQGRWDEAARRAQTVIETSGFNLVPSVTEPYQNEASAEIIFAVSFSSIDNTGVNDFPSSFYLPSALGGRGDANPPQGFIENADDGDLRVTVGQVERAEVNGPGLLYVQDGDIWTNKWTQPSLGDDFPVLRVGEMYLIRAEGLARGSGSAADARTHVNAVRNRAGLPDVDPSLSGQALIDEIIKQRRYELAFEADRRHDLQRLGRVLNSGSGSAPPGDPQRILPIPQREIDVNDALDQSSQNPGY